MFLIKLNLDKIKFLKSKYVKYPVPKWIQFCEEMIKDGWDVSYYDSRTTVSKYIFITKNNKCFKIRFSNHKANKYKEKEMDCDFYVGVSNFNVLKTEDLIIKLKEI